MRLAFVLLVTLALGCSSDDHKVVDGGTHDAPLVDASADARTCQLAPDPSGPCVGGACAAGSICVAGNCFGCAGGDCTGCLDAGACQANGATCSSNGDCCSGNCILRGSPGYCCVPGGCP